MSISTEAARRDYAQEFVDSNIPEEYLHVLGVYAFHLVKMCAEFGQISEDEWLAQLKRKKRLEKSLLYRFPVSRVDKGYELNRLLHSYGLDQQEIREELASRLDSNGLEKNSI